MEICDFCKVKLVEFYHFKNRSEEVRKIQTNQNSSPDIIEKSLEDKNIYNTFQIVQNFVEKNSICEIVEDENEKRLIFVAKSEPQEEFLEVEVVKNEPVAEEDLKPDETEYLEDIENIEEEPSEIIEEDEIELMELEEDYMNENEFVVEFEDDTEASFDNQQSASESCSDSRKSSYGRQRNPEQWACNKRKSLRNTGQSYLSTKGKVIEARKMRESCGSSCRSRCETKITENDRRRDFDTYWSLGDIVKQRKYIYQHITSSVPKRRRKESSNRTLTHHFHLDRINDDGTVQMVQVCKKMFKNTLAVSSQVIQGVVTKYAFEGFNDTRGKFERKLSDAQMFAVEHVKKFPFFYIEQTMTKVQCYQMYRDECAELGLVPVKEGNYRDIFDKQNLGNFLKTEKISCELCHRYYKADDDEKALLQKEHDDHISIGANKKCRDRALGRIRHKRAMERKKAMRMSLSCQ
jgi:hypothetical protein